MSSVRMLWTSEERRVCCATDTSHPGLNQRKETQNREIPHFIARSMCDQAVKGDTKQNREGNTVLLVPTCGQAVEKDSKHREINTVFAL